MQLKHNLALPNDYFGLPMTQRHSPVLHICFPFPSCPPSIISGSSSPLPSSIAYPSILHRLFLDEFRPVHSPTLHLRYSALELCAWAPSCCRQASPPCIHFHILALALPGRTLDACLTQAAMARTQGPWLICSLTRPRRSFYCIFSIFLPFPCEL
jgi:hypothetical protein